MILHGWCSLQPPPAATEDAGLSLAPRAHPLAAAMAVLALGSSLIFTGNTSTLVPYPAINFNLFICLFFNIYLFLAALGLRFCARAFSSCAERGPLFIAVRGPLTIAASLVAEHRLQTRRLSNCGSRAQPLRGMWDPPRPGPEPMSPALVGRFSTTAPPGKPYLILKKYLFI